MDIRAREQDLPWAPVYQELGISLDVKPIAEKSLADYVESHAYRLKDRPAIEYLGTTISYGQLDAYANQLAHVLRELGVGPGDVIGSHLPNTPQYLIALVAAAKLGAAVSGVSPLLTASELTHQVNDARIKVLITLDQFFNQNVATVAANTPLLKAVLVSGPVDFLPGWKRKLAYALNKVPRIKLNPMGTVRVQRLREQMAQASSARIHTAMHFDDTMYIQYTGGTTGKPKGAELTLRSVFSSLTQMDDFARYEAGRDTLASAFPYFHTAGLALGTLGLRQAARILVIPDPRNTALFCKTMREFPPTHLANVPTLFQMLLDDPDFKHIDFSRLKMAVSGAAPFAPEMIHRLEAVIGKGKLCEGYGMTESSGVTVLNPPGRAKVGSVGLPLSNTRVKIVDVDTGMHELPFGEAGEIIVNGAQVMARYLDNPEATAKTMRDFQGEIWLYTGDIGSMDEEGYITISDRAKDMLIVGGYKVFSVEVEGKLAELDCIELCAVIGTPDKKRPGNDIVNLHVQLSAAHQKRNQDDIRTEILDFCREHMSAYKVPKQIHFAEALPLTAVGKLDKKALR
ncbi:long-chain acyl-CoA synthetase [Pseudomonas pohangensis]|uniref:Long-chain acyl-CoA synthetase n=1 Tax=Pseudomonas pohangensis TaxID=364197 RepID=A0A1H2FAS0_9PSED|nr:AMP-binding protein [Pseudomonas pohangensis]SDU04434.1 long-chain acyl-CoA synthetase [Pseudomonas pohangensis]